MNTSRTVSPFVKLNYTLHHWKSSFVGDNES